MKNKTKPKNLLNFKEEGENLHGLGVGNFFRRNTRNIIDNNKKKVNYISSKLNTFTP